MHRISGRRIADLRPQPGRDGRALGASLLARHAGDGRRPRRRRAVESRHRPRAADLRRRVRAVDLAAASRLASSTLALNSRAETFAGVSYTSIYSHRDEVVVPNCRRDRKLLAAHRARRDHERRGPGHLPRRPLRAPAPRHGRPGRLGAVRRRGHPPRTGRPGADRPRGLLRRVHARDRSVDVPDRLAAAGAALAHTLLAYPQRPRGAAARRLRLRSLNAGAQRRFIL